MSLSNNLPPKRTSVALYTTVILMIVSTVLVVLYVLENLFVILESASIISVRPTKHKIPKDLIHREIVYDKKTGHGLDIYQAPLSASLDSLSRVLVVIPGGFWQGHHKKHYAHIAGVAYKEGMVTVIAQLPYYYGLVSRHFLSEEALHSRRFEAQLKAVKKVILWVKGNIKNYHGDPDHLILMGIDSGAQLLGSLFFISDYRKKFNPAGVKKLIFVSPILDVKAVSEEFQNQHVAPVFYGMNLSRLSLLRKDMKIDRSLFILQPESNLSFLDQQVKKFVQLNSKIQYEVIKKTSRKSLPFRIGREEEVTQILKSIFLFTGTILN